jgi:hypothetical protein
MKQERTEVERQIRERVLDLRRRSLPSRLTLLDDTTDFMAIDRDQLIELEGEVFLITGTEREKRFGLTEEPKPWVKRGVSRASGEVHILKLVFAEVFKVQIGAQTFRCARSAEKEARVLELVRGDSRFMQGQGLRDARGNLVRVLDFIRGQDLYTHLATLDLPHQEYFSRHLPAVLDRIIGSLAAIQRLHEAGLCHGDIRNDHIFVETGSGEYRWIDFDLDQERAAFAVWSVGNILHFVVGKGATRISQTLARRPDLVGLLRHEDAALFFPYRLQNLGKLYPYLPPCLNDVLLRFAVGDTTRYDTVAQVVDDLEGCRALLSPAEG